MAILDNIDNPRIKERTEFLDDILSEFNYDELARDAMTVLERRDTTLD